MFNLMKVTAAGADFVDECPEGVVCRFFRKYDDNDDNIKNDDTIKGASFLFSYLIFLSFQYFFAFARNITKSSSDPVGGMNLDMR